MDMEMYYGEELPRLRQAEQRLLELAKQYPVRKTEDGFQPIMYTKTRIKEPESMMRKLASQGLSTDCASALGTMHDAVGMRIITSFVDDVYEIRGWLRKQAGFQIITEKDYIAYPKPNGYRSLHLILKFTEEPEAGLKAEIQLRTIAIDFWAALEHQLKYKQQIRYEKIIREELKRCADEIASVDVSMQTIRDILTDK